MTREDIIRMAKEAGFEADMFGRGIWDSSDFNRFAALVAAAEREACLLELGNTANRLEESVKIIRNLLGK